MNSFGLRRTWLLLLRFGCITAVLVVATGAVRMLAQVAGPATPVMPTVQLSGGPPPLGPMKLRAVTGEPYSLTAKTVVEKKYTDGSWHATEREERRCVMAREGNATSCSMQRGGPF